MADIQPPDLDWFDVASLAALQRPPFARPLSRKFVRRLAQRRGGDLLAVLAGGGSGEETELERVMSDSQRGRKQRDGLVRLMLSAALTGRVLGIYTSEALALRAAHRNLLPGTLTVLDVLHPAACTCPEVS